MSINPLFFDFEFDGEVLISFGVTSNSGEQMYTEFVHPKSGFSSLFVQDTILPLLEKPIAQRKTKDEWLRSLTIFIQMFESPVFYCDSDMDAQLLLRSLPTVNVEIIELTNFDEEAAYNRAYNKSFDAVLSPRHHALNDAKAIKAGYIALNTLRAQQSKSAQRTLRG